MEQLEPRELRFEQSLHDRICSLIMLFCQCEPLHNDMYFMGSVYEEIRRVLEIQLGWKDPDVSYSQALFAGATVRKSIEVQCIADQIITSLRNKGYLENVFILCDPNEPPYSYPWKNNMSSS